MTRIFKADDTETALTKFESKSSRRCGLMRKTWNLYLEVGLVKRHCRRVLSLRNPSSNLNLRLSQATSAKNFSPLALLFRESSCLQIGGESVGGYGWKSGGESVGIRFLPAAIGTCVGGPKNDCTIWRLPLTSGHLPLPS